MKISNQLVPAFASTLLARIALGVGVSTVAIALTSTIVPQAASAQTAPGTALPDSSRQNERNTFSGGFGGGDFSLFDVIHRANLGTINMDEYSQDINRNLTSEADKFKQQQLQMLGRPQQQLPENSGTTPQQSNQQDK